MLRAFGVSGLGGSGFSGFGGLGFMGLGFNTVRYTDICTPRVK